MESERGLLSDDRVGYDIRWRRVALGLSCVLLTGVLLGVILPHTSHDPPPWDLVSSMVGWSYFVAWSVSFYPQVWLNWKRVCVVGLSFDYLVYNLLGYTAYSAYNCAMRYDTSVSSQYAGDHGGFASEVQVNDVVFSLHALILTLIVVVQCFIYERGGQEVSRGTKYIATCVSLFLVLYAVLCAAVPAGFASLDILSWMNFVYVLSFVKLGISVIKWWPQLLLNYRRKSTSGWNVYFVLLDFCGGALSVAQLVLDSAAKGNLASGVAGGFPKVALGVISIVFDTVFLLQHFVLYAPKPQEHASLMIAARNIV